MMMMMMVMYQMTNAVQRDHFVNYKKLFGNLTKAATILQVLTWTHAPNIKVNKKKEVTCWSTYETSLLPQELDRIKEGP